MAEGYHPSYGSGHLRRTVMRPPEDSLSEEFRSGSISVGDSALVDVDDSKQLVIHKDGSAPKQKLAAARV